MFVFQVKPLTKSRHGKVPENAKFIGDLFPLFLFFIGNHADSPSSPPTITGDAEPTMTEDVNDDTLIISNNTSIIAVTTSVLVLIICVPIILMICTYYIARCRKDPTVLKEILIVADIKPGHRNRIVSTSNAVQSMSSPRSNTTDMSQDVDFNVPQENSRRKRFGSVSSIPSNISNETDMKLSEMFAPPDPLLEMAEHFSDDEIILPPQPMGPETAERPDIELTALLREQSDPEHPESRAMTPQTPRGTLKPPDALEVDLSINSVIREAVEFGKFWDENCTEQMVEEWNNTYVPNLNDIRSALKGRPDEYKCKDPDCGWNALDDHQLLYPHQVIHCMVYHSNGMYGLPVTCFVSESSWLECL